MHDHEAEIRCLDHVLAAVGGGSGLDARPITGPDPSASDGRHGAVEGAEGQVSARLRPAVAAYFETVGRLAAESGPKDGPK